MKRAVFPGSFDPITLGHEDIIRRAMGIFDEIIVAVGINSEKKYLFPLEKRLEFIRRPFQDEKHILIDTYTGLTVDYCRNKKAGYLLRGLRNPADFEFEKAIAQTNRKLSGIETVFLLTGSDTGFISSSIVRDVYRHGGDISKLVPRAVIEVLEKGD